MGYPRVSGQREAEAGGLSVTELRAVVHAGSAKYAQARAKGRLGSPEAMRVTRTSCVLLQQNGSCPRHVGGPDHGLTGSLMVRVGCAGWSVAKVGHAAGAALGFPVVRFCFEVERTMSWSALPTTASLPSTAPPFSTIHATGCAGHCSIGVDQASPRQLGITGDNCPPGRSARTSASRSTR